jgi:hypothetical protein
MSFISQVVGFDDDIDTWTDIANAIPTHTGQLFTLKQHTSGGRGGGTLMALVGSVTDDGGIQKNCVGGFYLKRVHYTSVTPAMFGAIGDGAVDDWQSVQHYLTYIGSKGYVKTNTDLGAGTYLGSSIFGQSETCVYAISQTLVLPTNYQNVDFGNVLFVPHSSFNDADYAFNITAWNCCFKNLRIAKFSKAFTVANANLDIGVIIFDNLQASNIDTLFNLTTRSSFFKVTNYRFDNVKIVAVVNDGDRVLFERGWFSAGVMSSNNDAHFILNSSHSPGVEIYKMFYVPTPQTSNGTAIVKISSGTLGRVTIDKSLFGGEAGQIPIVSNYGTAAVGLSRGCHITITNTMLFTTDSGSAGGARASVELHALPNSVILSNCYGAIEESGTKGLINYVADVTSFATALANTAGASVTIRVDGRTPSNFAIPSSQRAELATLFQSDLPIRRAYASGVSNSVGVIILNQADAGRGRVYKIMLSNPDNSGADRYSEYVAVASPAASPSSSWTIAPIVEGSSTVAGRLVVNGSGHIEARGNSVAVTDIEAVMTQITNTTIY